MESVYLYICDALRLDHANEALTPRMMAFARDGVQFTNAVSAATWSHPSMLAMMTGLHPTAVGKFGALPDELNPRQVGLPVTVKPLAEIFQQGGWYTAAFSANIFFSPTYGMDRGFDEMPLVYELPALAQRSEISKAISKRLGRKRQLMLPLITSKDLHDVRQANRSEIETDKLFTVIWSMDTHDPFYDRQFVDQLATDQIDLLQHAREDVARAKTLYEVMVRYTDQQFSAFIEELKTRGEYDNALIIVCADHGESFGEGERFGHTGLAFEEQIRIPLMMKLPGQQFSGQIIDEQVSLMDIVPTLLDWYKIEQSYTMHGQSLLPVIRGEAAGHEQLYFYDETIDRYYIHGAVRTASSKYIFRLEKHVHYYDALAGQARFRLRQVIRRVQDRITDKLLSPLPLTFQDWLFDLKSDPLEETNIASSQKAVVQNMRRAFDSARSEFLRCFKQQVGAIRIVKTDHRVQQRLRDLGYLEQE